MDRTDDQLIRFMELPASYDHRPDEVHHLQTHISHVFLAGPLVYKIKKSVNFEFLDFSTLEKRAHFCHREVELNRRLCREIYLGVVPIYRETRGESESGERPEFRFGETIEPGGNATPGNGDGEYIPGDDRPPPLPGEDNRPAPVEYAVKMKRLSDEHFLHALLERREVDRAVLDRIAKRLAEFYRTRDPDEKVLEGGRPEAVRFNTGENFRQTSPYVGTTIEKPAYSAIKRYTERWIERHTGLLERRIREKRIVDGHGDLHLEHIHMTPERICIYDCIEFNERFRYGDIAADLAFLAMDLDFRERWTESRYFVSRMAEMLDDPDLPDLITFYKCYRAYVKGKVKSFQSAEEEVPKKDREAAHRLATRYFGLALRYAVTGSSPTALIFMGPVGSGKSTLAAGAGEALGIEPCSSDRVRKQMAGVEPGRRTPEGQRKRIYTAEWTRRTYRRLAEKAMSRLEDGKDAILDATYGVRQRREELISSLEEAGFDYCFIETGAPDRILRERLQHRESLKEVVSDARLEDFEMLRDTYESPEELDDRHRIPVDTDRPLSESLEQLYRQLADRHLERTG